MVDGAGSPPYGADVLVQGDIISAISPAGRGLTRRRAQKEIDGLGNYLTPGFIDVHSTSDHYLTLFADPTQTDRTDEGVTTTIGGHCGASLAPLLYGSLESIRKWADPYEININWHTTEELLKVLDTLPIGVNFGTLVGQTTIRRALVGEEDRRLTVKELGVFEAVFRQALKEGAFGLSTGLGYAHAREVSPKEVKTLAKIVAEFGGVHATHLKGGPDELLDSVKETVKIARETGAKTIVSHFNPIKGYGDEFDEAMKLLERAAHKAIVHFIFEPHSARLQSLYTLLPESLKRGNLETMLEAISDKKTADFIKREWQKLDLSGMRILSAPHHPYLAGRKVEDADDLLNLMTVSGLRATISNPDIDEERLEAALMNSLAFIASGGPHAENTFPQFLQTVVKVRGVPIEQAVKKITYDPAAYFNIKKRGAVKEKNVADLVIVGKNDYKVKQTILGGKVVGEEETKGEILRHT